MNQPKFDLKQANRWFAVELNNLAWNLVEAAERSPADEERMIHAAHAACYHWLEVGNLLNHLRAQCLLATAYTKVRFGQAAVNHAQRCVELSGEAGDTQTAFDRATAHGCASTAYALMGQMDDAIAQHRLAMAAAEGFDDPSEAEVLHRLYPAPPMPGNRPS
jgi:hypothetical protein